MKTVREWSKVYVGDVVRATHPYTPIDQEKIIQNFERMYPDLQLDAPVVNVDDDTLNAIGQLLHCITIGALHLSHHKNTGHMHPGLSNIRV